MLGIGVKSFEKVILRAIVVLTNYRQEQSVSPQINSIGFGVKSFEKVILGSIVVLKNSSEE